MKLTTRLAWRNVWRNKTRTSIFISAGILGFALAVLSLNLMKSISAQRLEDSITIQTGHLQIHKIGFTDNYEIGLFIQDEAGIEQYLREKYARIQFTKRQVVTAMVASPENSFIGVVKGVVPDKEREVSIIREYITAGDWLDTQIENPVLISKRTSDKLGLTIGAKTIITLSNINDELEGAAFRVCGIYETPNSEFDEMTVFVNFSDLSKLTGLTNAHEIAIIVKDEANLDIVQRDLTESFNDVYQIRNWKQLLPELFAFSGFTDLVSILFTIIILLGLGFGLLNTMNMIIQERTREIGMLRAIGQSQGSVFLLLIKESGLMMFLGAFTGVLLGILIVVITSHTGINLGEGLAALGIRTVIYPRIFAGQLMMLVSLTLIITLIISILPASRAYKIDPSEALKDI